MGCQGRKVAPRVWPPVSLVSSGIRSWSRALQWPPDSLRGLRSVTEGGVWPAMHGHWPVKPRSAAGDICHSEANGWGCSLSLGSAAGSDSLSGMPASKGK